MNNTNTDTAEPVRHLVCIQHRDAWGDAKVTEEEHSFLCRAMEAWLTANEGDALSIRVRPSRQGEVDGLYAVRDGVPTGPDLSRCDPEATLINRAWIAAVSDAAPIMIAIDAKTPLFAAIDEDTVWGLGTTVEDAMRDGEASASDRSEEAPALDLRVVDITPEAAEAVLDGTVEFQSPGALAPNGYVTLILADGRIDVGA